MSPGDNHVVVMIGDKDCDLYDDDNDNDEVNDDNVYLDDFCPRPRTRPNRRKSVFHFQLNLVRCVQLLIVMIGSTLVRVKFFLLLQLISKVLVFASIFIFLRHKLSRHSLSSHQVHLLRSVIKLCKLGPFIFD